MSPRCRGALARRLRRVAAVGLLTIVAGLLAVAHGAGRIYNTGIDLANDALFSTIDGGRSWDRGTVQCHDGDRPWLAGGQPNEVFLATNASTGGPDGSGGHLIFRSADGGNSCSSEGIPDQQTSGAGQYIG